MTLADEIRSECARIIKRNFGIDRALGAVRIETVEKIAAYVDAAETRLASCTCQPDEGFQIRERDDGKFAGRMFGVYAKAEADFQAGLASTCAKLRRPVEECV